MSLSYTFLSEKKELENTQLQICGDDNERISVLQYKAEGQLLYSHQRGMHAEDENRQIGQISEFLKKAGELGADLVITPEASVPIAVIQTIIQDGSFPEAGKLWCLGAEGIPKEEYHRLTDEWSKNKEIIFIHPQINFVKHVNVMFYFFMAGDGRRAVVMQAKTGAMRDTSFEHEQADLSTGNEIFIVDLNGGREVNNVLATLICADILNIDATEFCNIFQGKSPVVLNIQMNAKPYHGKIVEFRKVFFTDKYIRNGQMIVANWGRETSIRIEGTAKTGNGHSDSGSTIYLAIENNHGRDQLDEILSRPKFVKSIGEAQMAGLEYFLTRDYEVWKIQEDIQAVFYYIKQGYLSSTKANIMLRRYLPYIGMKFRYNAANELEEDPELRCDCSEVNEILRKIGIKRASKDIHNCAGKKCANLSCRECARFYIDYLVSLCLGEDVMQEYLVSGGKSNRATQTLYQDSKESEKKEQMGKLVQCLEEKRFPERFAEFRENDNFLFVVNYHDAENGGNNRYNLELKRAGQNSRKILVVFLGYVSLREVKQKYIQIRESLYEERQADILIYYIDDNGRQVYSEPYEQESILAHNNDFIQNIESFK